MNRAAGNRQTRIRLVEYLEPGDDPTDGEKPVQVFKTLPNVLINYGQKYSELKKMIEISARLHPDDPSYSIEQIRIKSKGGEEALDEKSLNDGQIKKIIEANPVGNKVSLTVFVRTDDSLCIPRACPSTGTRPRAPTHQTSKAPTLQSRKASISCPATKFDTEDENSSSSTRNLITSTVSEYQDRSLVDKDRVVDHVQDVVHNEDCDRVITSSSSPQSLSLLETSPTTADSEANVTTSSTTSSTTSTINTAAAAPLNCPGSPSQLKVEHSPVSSPVVTSHDNPSGADETEDTSQSATEEGKPHQQVIIDTITVDNLQPSDNSTQQSQSPTSASPQQPNRPELEQSPVFKNPPKSIRKQQRLNKVKDLENVRKEKEEHKRLEAEAIHATWADTLTPSPVNATTNGNTPAGLRLQPFSIDFSEDDDNFSDECSDDDHSQDSMLEHASSDDEDSEDEDDDDDDDDDDDNNNGSRTEVPSKADRSQHPTVRTDYSSDHGRQDSITDERCDVPVSTDQEVDHSSPHLSSPCTHHSGNTTSPVCSLVTDTASPNYTPDISLCDIYGDSTPIASPGSTRCCPSSTVRSFDSPMYTPGAAVAPSSSLYNATATTPQACTVASVLSPEGGEITPVIAAATPVARDSDSGDSGAESSSSLSDDSLLLTPSSAALSAYQKMSSLFVVSKEPTADPGLGECLGEGLGPGLGPCNGVGNGVGASVGPASTSSSRSRMNHIKSNLFSPGSSTASMTLNGKVQATYNGGKTRAEAAAQYQNNIRQYDPKKDLGHIRNNKRKGNKGMASTAPSSSSLSSSTYKFADMASGKGGKSGASKSSDSADIEGRPSIGTLTAQWEFMRTNFVNNNDEELDWLMVSKRPGAYKYAKKKNNDAEDKYFKALFDIEASEGKMKKAGQSATTIATILTDISAENTNHQANRKSEEVMGRLKALLDLLTNTLDLSEQGESEQRGVMFSFSESTQTIIRSMLVQPLAVETDKQKFINLARKIVAIVPVETQILRSTSAKAQKDSDDALSSMEKWAKRETETLDYAANIQMEEEDWFKKEQSENNMALSTMRSYIPVHIEGLKLSELLAAAKVEGGLMTMELATELKNNKLLHWIVSHPEDIAKANFLSGSNKSCFENLEGLDITEMRAIAAWVPAKFELDKDGKKAEWRSRMMTRTKQLVAQYNGEKVKGSWDEAVGKRVKVSLPPLKPDQTRRAIYYYRTKEQSDQRLKGYDDKMQLLAKKENWLAKAEHEAAAAKVEFNVVLEEMRDPDMKDHHAQLSSLKETARKEKDESEKRRKALFMEVQRLKQTIKENPVTREQFIHIEQELQSFLLENGHPNWDQLDEAPFQIAGIFDPIPEIKRTERQAAKFVSAEQEAEQRKNEIANLKSASTAPAACGSASTDAFLSSSLGGEAPTMSASLQAPFSSSLSFATSSPSSFSSSSFSSCASEGGYDTCVTSSGSNTDTNSSGDRVFYDAQLPGIPILTQPTMDEMHTNNEGLSVVLQPAGGGDAITGNRRTSISLHISNLNSNIKKNGSSSSTGSGDPSHRLSLSLSSSVDNKPSSANTANPSLPSNSGRKNSVLANANPDMLRTLNGMFSPGAPPSKIARPKGLSSGSVAVSNLHDSLNASITPSPAEETPVAEVKEVKKTKSKLLQRLLAPEGPSRPAMGAMGGLFGKGGAGAGAGMSFLDQIKAKKLAKSAPCEDDANDEASAISSAVSAVPTPSPPLSFLDEIKLKKQQKEAKMKAKASDGAVEVGAAQVSSGNKENSSFNAASGSAKVRASKGPLGNALLRDHVLLSATL